MVKVDKGNETSEVLILLSGGIDSASLVHYHLLRGDKVSGVFFNYGHSSYHYEYQSAMAISQHYGIRLKTADLGFKIREHEGEFYCRNALFVVAACSFLESTTSLISIGIHSGTPYYDSTPSFIDETQRILDGYFGGVVRLIAPFLEYSKLQVYEFAQNEVVPIHLTYSCEKGQPSSCGICLSCVDRRMLDDKPSRKN